jgi:hypothetical protein
MPPPVRPPVRCPHPHWDKAARILRAGERIIKQFKQPAEAQERILDALEELAWQPVIDDPLPRQSNQDPKQRLHHTINNLNRNQRNRLIRFFGNGTGQCICWEWVS